MAAFERSNVIISNKSISKMKCGPIANVATNTYKLQEYIHIWKFLQNQLRYKLSNALHNSNNCNNILILALKKIGEQTKYVLYNVNHWKKVVAGPYIVHWYFGQIPNFVNSLIIGWLNELGLKLIYLKQYFKNNKKKNSCLFSQTRSYLALRILKLSDFKMRWKNVLWMSQELLKSTIYNTRYD